MRFDSEVRAVIAAISILAGIAAAYATLQDGGGVVLAVLGKEGRLDGYPGRAYEGSLVEVKVLVENMGPSPGLYKVEAFKGCTPEANSGTGWSRVVIVAPGDSVELRYEGKAGGLGCSREYVVFKLYEYNREGWVYAGRTVYLSYQVIPLGVEVGG